MRETGIFYAFRRLLSSPKITSCSYGGYSFEIPSLNNKGITLTPRPITIKYDSRTSPVIADLDSVWDLKKFRTARHPLKVGIVEDRTAFERATNRVLDMLVKVPKSSEYRIPEALWPLIPLLQQIIDHEHAILSKKQLDEFYAYVTFDKKLFLKKGEMQRKPGCHVDGFQGARIYPKNKINHSYVVSNGTPTAFYPHPFDFSHLDERVHNFFVEMDAQAKKSHEFLTEPYNIYLMDAYTVHCATYADRDYDSRTFVRVSYDTKEFDRLGNTINPLFQYSWDMKPREIQDGLICYKPLDGREIALIAEGNYPVINDHLVRLKDTDLEKYYNFAYACLIINSFLLTRLVLANLVSDGKCSFQTLRLLSVAALAQEAKIAALGKNYLHERLLVAKKDFKANLLEDFVQEINAQQPDYFEHAFLEEFKSPDEIQSDTDKYTLRPYNKK